MKSLMDIRIIDFFLCFHDEESDDLSSSDDENLSDNNNSSSTISKMNNNHETSNGTARINQNERIDSSANFPIPSTSTGITGNGNLDIITRRRCILMTLTSFNRFQILFYCVGANFRIVQTPDSDDEPTPDSSPISQNVQAPATKVNGVHHTTSTAPAYSSGVDDDQPSERNSRRKRNHSLTTTNYHFTNYSSHSSSRLSNSSSDGDDTSSDDSSLPFFSNHLSKRPKQAENNEASSTASLLRLERTTRSRDPKDCELTTPDSGIGSTPGSSTPR